MSKIGLNVAETVFAFAILVMGAYFMKRKGMMRQEDGTLFARLLTQVILPATIFYQLWTHRLSSETLAPVMIMFLMGVMSLAISWIAGIILKFDHPNTGALMIVSSFGSSALIGYPIIQYAFGSNSQALAEGIIISELGVGLPIFIFCPAVAMWFGGTLKNSGDLRRLAKDYFLSPIFLAVILGLVMSRVDIPADMPLVEIFKDALKMVQGALVVVAAVILGLQLSFRPMKGFGILIVVSIAIQMLLQPWFNSFMAGLFRVTEENTQVLVLIAAMPAAILGPVFAARYNCAAQTASLLTFTHIVISPVVVPVVFTLFD